MDVKDAEAVFARYQEAAALHVTEKRVPKTNWNEEWEKHYDPIYVGDQVYIRASFHPAQPAYRHEILINPKMSFGTGHHATTHQMIAFQLELPHADKAVLDAGSGTGILAVMAAKLGAARVEAFDIDPWCVENGNENFALNGLADSLQMGLGTIREVPLRGPYDLLLANINKNVLLDELPVYAALLAADGHLLLSGFYEEDIPDLEAAAAEVQLKLLRKSVKDRWAALIFQPYE
ncbi:ribosomal protein L11 methyltransferase [Nitritalea halalkaliphila LW7]|uniref:Ribosomal protein L11 methyltransferase n=1 Tax=Nitritalea halalkaliphila LW7 TaxID=1189621 RepID=I5C5T7_9BACT|nr:50S ribosomal protein L11 methyltransferase [Nitritalea halalkaliphila]EIM77189.1 ribosomal protein L11 methyltransferase [Nitritalea halalkaliphila LW7]